MPFSETDSLKIDTPYSAYHGKAADLMNLRILGCKADILYPQNLFPQKWQAHNRNGKYIMIGMTSSKIWKLLDTLTLRDTISADVEFNEYEFPSIDIKRFMLPAEPEKLTPKEIPLEKGDEYQPQPIIAKQKGVRQPRQKYAAIRPMRADVNRRVQNSELLNPVSRPQEAREASDQRNLQAENVVKDLPTALVEQETPTKLVEQTNHREHKNKTLQIIQIAPEQSMVEQTSSSIPKSN